MALKEILEDIGIRLKHDHIVGRNYHFGTTYNGKPLEIKGVVTHFHHAAHGSIQYGVHSLYDQGVQVVGLLKVGKVWFIQVTGGDMFVINLEGNFTLV